MSWRNQGITGSNNIPLGKSRRFGGEAEANDDRSDPGNAYGGGFANGDRDMKRGRSPEPSMSTPLLSCFWALW